METIDFTAAGGGKLLLGPELGKTGHFLTPDPENGKDIALSNDGRIVYTASGWPYLFPGYSTDGAMSTVRTLPANPYPNNIEVAGDGRVFCASANFYDAADLWIYDTDGFLVKSFLLRGYAQEIRDRTLTVSGDGFFAVASTVVPNLQIVLVGP